jgi:hypothetical protein
MAQQYLFICGCPRSGTTALVRLLNSHNSLAIDINENANFIFKDNLLKKFIHVYHILTS